MTVQPYPVDLLEVSLQDQARTSGVLHRKIFPSFWTLGVLLQSVREAATKSSFLSGPATKAFSPPLA